MLIDGWLPYLVPLGILLVGARKHLGGALAVAAVVLGVLTVSPSETASIAVRTLRNPRHSCWRRR